MLEMIFHWEKEISGITTRSSDPWTIGNVCIYDIRTGHVARSMQHNWWEDNQHYLSVESISVLVVTLGGVKVWDADTGSNVLDIDVSHSGRSTDPVVGIDISPNEEYVMACTGGNLFYSQLYARGSKQTTTNNINIPSTTLGKNRSLQNSEVHHFWKCPYHCSM
eukprot:gnl/Chilomastix_caulleri/7914.p1 GENE.gnl/Chilomastix_caulleri/7914~~gnl/Chilomastix_caulleri/7914.p1  ORF type:complete len:164 (+),score=22.85 gnl/Chilomastix_caulleri/7914:82-573(+)